MNRLQVGRPSSAPRLPKPGMKWCNYTRHFAPIGDFKGRDGYCKECRKLYTREYRARKGNPYKDTKREFIAIKGGGCQGCGTKDERVLTVHHIDREEGKQDGGRQSKYVKKAVKHPERFLCLCRNCHWLVHHSEDFHLLDKMTKNMV